MPFDKQRQIQTIRILLTVSYGIFLLGPYLTFGTVFTIRRSEPFYVVWLIVYSAVRLISVIFVTYAIWFDHRTGLCVSGIVLSVIFTLKSALGIIGVPDFPSTNFYARYFFVRKSDRDGNVQLSIELLVILFAIWATFSLIRYVEAKYAPAETETI